MWYAFVPMRQCCGRSSEIGLSMRRTSWWISLERTISGTGRGCQLGFRSFRDGRVGKFEHRKRVCKDGGDDMDDNSQLTDLGIILRFPTRPTTFQFGPDNVQYRTLSPFPTL